MLGIRRYTVSTLVTLLSLGGMSILAQQMSTTQRRPVTDEYFGTKIADDYRWLEDWNDPAVKAWSDAQNAHARAVLDAMPNVEAIRERVTQLRGAGVVSYRLFTRKAEKFFALKLQPPRQQPLLVTFANPDHPEDETVVVDPMALDASGLTSMDWYVPSPDGRLVAVSLSEAGSERGTLHIIEAATGKQTGELVPRVNYGTAGGSMGWLGDSTGFYYTRYPAAGERPAEDLDFYVQIYFHQIGTPVERDRYEVGREFPRIGEPKIKIGPDGHTVLVNVQNGDGGEFSQFIKPAGGEWTKLTSFQDEVAAGYFAQDGSLLFLSRKNAPHGKILKLALAPGRTPSMASASTLIPERRDAVVEFDYVAPDTVVPTATRIYVVDQWGGPNQISMFTLDGQPLGTVPIPPVSSVPELLGLARDGVLMRVGSYVAPDAWFELADGQLQPRALSSKSPADFSDIEVTREFATSRDGTKVPVNIIARKGTKLDGTNPTVLSGYGGYGINQRPVFQAINKIWLEQGGVLAVANIRGGAEFGEEWHKAGMLTSKQNVFDDFIAAAEHLIARKYTSPTHLAIRGGSNGGLLMGAVLTQRPDLVRAVVSHVGIYDMVRVELSSNGSFNVPEFGTVKDPDQFQAMYRYSPYHHVKPGTKYPSVLFLTGANDPRVDPMHSRKMTARLQEATGQADEVLLRTSAAAGHGLGTALSEVIEQDVDVYSFLFANVR